jgi:predicted AAA+ superfamily ATPase
MPEGLAGTHREALTEILADSLTSPLPDGVERRIRGRVALPGKATAVVGMRRAGKTMFVHQLRRERLARAVPRVQLPYVNFEDERLAGLEGRHLGFLLEEYGRRAAGTARDGPVFWCFDEIQWVPGWERFVRRLLDTGGAEVVVTGSSAALLSREIATAMRGRAWEVAIFPFSFAEALAHRGMQAPADAGFLPAAERARIERAFLDWLNAGGFPEAQGLDEASRRQLLRDYVDVAILRDVVERHQVSNVLGLRWLVRHLLGNAAATFSVEKFHAVLKSQGVAISRDTVHQLLGYVEDCFLVRTVWMEAGSERQRMVNPRKTYPVDPGLIPIFDRSGRGNIGHALETAVLIELERRRCTVTYVRTAGGFEVDFLAREPDGGTHLIQVCADASTAATAARELRALHDARQAHPEARPWLLTLTRDGTPAAAEDVTVQPAYQWILSDAPAGVAETS